MLHHKCDLCEKWINDYGAAISFNMGREEDGSPNIKVSRLFETYDDLRICHECVVELRKSSEMVPPVSE